MSRTSISYEVNGTPEVRNTRQGDLNCKQIQQPSKFEGYYYIDSMASDSHSCS